MMTINFEDEILEALKTGRATYKDLLQLKDYIDIDTLTNIFERYTSTIKEVH